MASECKLAIYVRSKLKDALLFVRCIVNSKVAHYQGVLQINCFSPAIPLLGINMKKPKALI